MTAFGRIDKDVYQEILEDMRISLASFEVATGSIPRSDSQPAAFYTRVRVVYRYFFGIDDLLESISYVRRATTVLAEYIRRVLRLAGEGSQDQEGEQPPPP